jgi:hypothetical protein
MRILFVTASAVASMPLNVDLEYARVHDSLRGIDRSWSDQLRLSPATQLPQLASELLDYKPDIVHFSGHCKQDGSLELVDALGRPHSARPRAIARLLLAAPGAIRMVMLNACYSAMLADLLREKIPVVIGFETEISDNAALAFSPMFYRALATPGTTLRQAIDHGRAGMDASGRNESDSIRLLTAEGVDAESCIYAPTIVRTRVLVPDDELSALSLEWAREINPAVTRPLIVPRDVLLRDREHLPMWDFAVLLLRHSVSLTKTAEGDLLQIDLRHQTHGIYNNDGKKFLAARFLGPKLTEKLRQLSRRIQHFQRSKAQRTMELLGSDTLPVLRWASAGYLPIVCWRKRRWALLFFRDIFPIGWNIANGASETPTEWHHLDKLAAREAREEVVVLQQDPVEGDHVGVCRIDLGHSAEANADDLLSTHHELRWLHDRIRLKSQPMATIPVRNIEGRGVVEVLDDSGSHRTAGIHVSINPLELGIEVTRVGEFDLPDDGCVIDGETFLDLYKVPDGGRPKPRLVRRPVGLFDLEYLRRAWLSGEMGEEAMHEGRLLPPPRPGDVIVFDYDIRRRRELVIVDQIGYYRESKWLEKWDHLFSRHLGDSPALRTLCPAAWKIIEAMFEDEKI